MFGGICAAVFRGGMAGKRFLKFGTQPGDHADCHRFNGGCFRHISAGVGGQRYFFNPGQKYDCRGQRRRQQYLQHCPGAGFVGGIQPD